MDLAQRIRKPGPKKILALGGGNILGLVTVEALLEIEGLLRSESGRNELVPADYFEFACGTGTGAEIATRIPPGMPMDPIRRCCLESGFAALTMATVEPCERFAGFPA
jgi:hypothetical protein